MVVAAPRQRQEKFSDHVSPISPKAAEGTWKADHQPLPGGSIYDVPLSDDGREASSLQSKSRSGALFEMSDSYILQAKQEALQLSNGYSPGKEAVMEDGGSTSHRRVLRETVLRRQKSQGKPCHVPIESDDNEFGYGRQRAVTIPPERAAKSEFCRPMPVTQDPSTIASKPLIRRTIEVRVPRVKPSNIIDLETSSSDCDSEANGLSRSNLSSPSEDARSRYAPSPKLGSVHYNTFEEGLASHPGRQTKPAQNGTEDEMLATASPYESFIPDKLWRHRSVARGRGVTTDAGAPVHTAEDHSPRSGNKNIGSTLKHKTPQQAQVEHRATTVQPSPTATRRSLRTIARYPEFIRLLSESLIPEPSSRRGRQWNDKCLASPSAAQASRDSGSSQAGNRPLTRSSRSKTAPRLESERRSMNPRASRDQQAESDFEESYFASRASYRGERGRFTRDASILSVPSPSRILRSSGSRLDGN
ncbi:MAG: hypothetical protein MMC23_008315 [Stictis urceolatum]|nr:hypothetical protein [Stictis urceolata]